MTRRARRIYYLSATALFLVVGPSLVVWTGGYRWSGWRGGFVSTGALAVFSNPPATVMLNGQPRGSTPRRLNHLPPGNYTIELRRDGYGVWQHAVTIAAHTAQVIGPVALMPPNFTVTNQPLANATLVATDHRDTVFNVIDQSPTWTTNELWPDSFPTFSLPWAPSLISLSPNRQTLIASDGEQSAVVTRGRETAPWLIDRVGPLVWDSTTDNIFYAVQKGQLVKYDAFDRQITTRAAADSMDLSGDYLWLTQFVDGVTSLIRQKSFGQDVPDVMLRLDGDWAFIAGPPGELLIQNSATHELVWLQTDPLNGQIITTSFGPMTKLWWFNRSQLPLWSNGNDLLTLDEQGRTLLLDRYANPPTMAQWIVPGHIIAIMTGQTFSLQSISNRQGRGPLLTHDFTAATELDGLNVSDRTALFNSADHPRQLVELHW